MPEPTQRELLMVVLHDPGHLNDVLTGLLEAGIVNASAIETQGLGRLLSRDLPIFASFRHLFAGSRPYSYTVLAPVESPEVTREVIGILRDLLSDVPPEDRGIVLSMPITQYVDLAEGP